MSERWEFLSLCCAGDLCFKSSDFQEKLSGASLLSYIWVCPAHVPLDSSSCVQAQEPVPAAEQIPPSSPPPGFSSAFVLPKGHFLVVLAHTFVHVRPQQAIPKLSWSCQNLGARSVNCRAGSVRVGAVELVGGLVDTIPQVYLTYLVTSNLLLLLNLFTRMFFLFF